MNSNYVIMIIFVVLLFVGVPIGVAIGLTMFSVPFWLSGTTVTGEYVFRNTVAALDTYVVLAVPLFIFCGILMGRGGLSKRLFDFFSFFVGKLTGGMLMCVVVTCLFYGAISGSAPATVAAVGAMTLPLLVNLGYDKRFCTALVCTAGTLGIIIPPSIPFIWYGMTASQSISDLFIAGILPGILIGVCLMIYCYIYCKVKGEDREKLMQNYQELRAMGLKKLFFESILALIMPIFVLGGIYGGIVTPTEAACVAVVYSWIVCQFVLKVLKPKDYPHIFRETLKTIAPVMFIVAVAMVFGRVLTLMNAPTEAADFLTGVFESKIALLLFINVFLLIIGMFIESVSAILILTPILLPMMQSVGVSGIQFGVIMICNLAIGFVTPPIGLNLYVASGMSNLPVMEISKKAIPMLLVFFAALLLITFVEWFSLALL